MCRDTSKKKKLCSLTSYPIGTQVGKHDFLGKLRHVMLFEARGFVNHPYKFPKQRKLHKAPMWRELHLYKGALCSTQARGFVKFPSKAPIWVVSHCPYTKGAMQSPWQLHETPNQRSLGTGRG